ncbi:SpoIID/LytB domain-containing protein [Bacillus sp. DX1.1]|uniref:SpoIID/LytB domain-containing protein n=1 Tax=unclassified Bacillus (in: firmicutes) TaxID=185979 RepID=UPI0025708C0C|nr:MULTISPECIES: SpoIID/LytB domain-containing protein [unclassified Bacillus (in: firmicutes)]MDM5154412.1 SpoIID/LytB domain-containing protein [Bacillus sp. DX1.1]WJE83317.1 SpoIID/LytB domain-containing protein [Bacillus sp. DX3.1]
MIGYNPYQPDLVKRSFYQNPHFYNEEYYNHGEECFYRASTGKLIVSVYEMNTEKPIKGARVSIRKQEGHSPIITTLQTNEIGQTNVVSLPAPPKEYASDPLGPKPYAEYILTIEAPNYGVKVIRGVQIFAETTARQKVEMVPIIRTGNQQSIKIIDIPKHKLTEQYLERQLQPQYSSSSCIPSILYNVKIPEFIIVHDGEPHAQAPRYRVTFKDYIKNVAASEIYPTWPKEALRANIVCMTSFALNRICRGHYFVRGFTISSSTQFDQSYNHGKNTFAEIDDIVDEVINQYITEPYSIEPLLIPYCSGIRTCPIGYFSRWGSKYLADQGRDYLSIIRSYYPVAEIRLA